MRGSQSAFVVVGISSVQVHVDVGDQVVILGGLGHLQPFLHRRSRLAVAVHLGERSRASYSAFILDGGQSPARILREGRIVGIGVVGVCLTLTGVLGELIAVVRINAASLNLCDPMVGVIFVMGVGNPA